MSRFVPIGLAVIAFAVTYVICTRNPSAGADGQNSVVAAAKPDTKPMTPNYPRLAAQTPVAAAASPQQNSTPAAQNSAAPETVTAPEETRHDPVNDLVPVMVRFGPNDGSGRTLSVRNQASEPLSLTVTAANSGTVNRSIQVTLAPYTNTNLTETTGFVAAHGDVITIESPSFRDRVVHVE